MNVSQKVPFRRTLKSVWHWINRPRFHVALPGGRTFAPGASGMTPDDARAHDAGPQRETAVDKSAVGNYWSEAQRTQDPFSPEVYWLANPTVRRRYSQKAARGASHESWYVYCLRKYLGQRLPVERMLSIGCGAGGLEFDLARLNAFTNFDAWDLAAGSIEQAQRRAAEQRIAGLNFAVQDAETARIPRGAYDAVWFNMSLHHIGELERVLGNVATALKPDGFLFLNEYVGPDRFDFSEREKEIMSCVFRLLPSRFRRSFAPSQRGQTIETASFPDPADVARADPSESIRSGDIIPCVQARFDIVEWNPCGGTLLQFLLGNIMGNFREDDRASRPILQMLFDIEDTLIEAGEISSHFALIVARPRSSSATS
jgi:SAM-dependent methyltransferase